MKQQTFITKLLDNNNRMIDFERWNYKRIQTVEQKLKELYTNSIYESDIKKSKYIAIYEASNNEKQIEIKRIPINEFLLTELNITFISSSKEQFFINCILDKGYKILK